MATHFVLNTGAKIPSVGLGTWQADPAVVGDAVYAAVKVSPFEAPALLWCYVWLAWLFIRQFRCSSSKI
jgi:hypothetical protein